MKAKVKSSSNVRWLVSVVMMMLVLAACTEEPQPTVVSRTPATPSTAYPEPDEQLDGGYPAPAYPEPGYPAPDSRPGMLFDAVEPIPQFEGRLAFHSDRAGPLQIYSIDGATGDFEPLIVMPSQSFEPSWAPDCQELAFTAGAGGAEGFDVFITSGEGLDIAPLAADRSLLEWAAAWSPTGDLIAYQNNQDNLLNVCFADLDGSSLGCLERGNFSNAMPAWSPDGSLLAFGSNRFGDWELFVTDYPQNGEPLRLTENPEIDFYPAFSPDGSRIVYASQRSGNFEIVTVDPDGEGEQILTENPADDTTPAWVGNDQIVFSSFRGDDWELYLMNSDGSMVGRLTYHEGVDEWPAWCSAE